MMMCADPRIGSASSLSEHGVHDFARHGRIRRRHTINAIASHLGHAAKPARGVERERLGTPGREEQIIRQLHRIVPPFMCSPDHNATVISRKRRNAISKRPVLALGLDEIDDHILRSDTASAGN
jgi:hypothetical protein